MENKGSAEKNYGDDALGKALRAGKLKQVRLSVLCRALWVGTKLKSDALQFCKARRAEVSSRNLQGFALPPTSQRIK